MKTVIQSLFVLFALVAFASPALAVERQVSGYLRYEDQTPDGTFTALRPIRFVNFSIENPSGPPGPFNVPEPLGMGVTDSNGYFTLKVDSKALPPPGSPLRVVFQARNYVANVYLDLDGFDDRLTWIQDIFVPSGGSAVDLSVVVPRAASSGANPGFSVHFSILDAITLTRMYADARRGDGDDISEVDVQYPDEKWSHHASTWGDITLAGPRAFGAGGSDVDHGWQDGVVIHEMGHHIVSDISQSRGGGGDHTICEGKGYDFAWSEGFPSYLGAAVFAAFPGTIDVDSPAEGNGCTDPTSEYRTTSALWDVHDGVNLTAEPSDRIDGSALVRDATDGRWKDLPTMIFQILDKELDGTFSPNILGFHEGYIRRRPGALFDNQLDRVLGNLGIFPHSVGDIVPSSVPTTATTLAAGGKMPLTLAWSQSVNGLPVEARVYLMNLGAGVAELDRETFSTFSGAVSREVAIPTTLRAGRWAVVMELDPADAVFEDNEGNNTILAYVDVLPRGSFLHRASAANVSGNTTYLDDARINGNPNALVYATHVFNPGGAGGTYDDHPIGVWYDAGRARWGIYNEDPVPMPATAAFNVTVNEGFVHRATAGNVSGDATYIDHPLANGNPNARVQVTHLFNTAGNPGVYSVHPLGVWYDGSRWAIFNQDIAALQAGTAYNVSVTTGSGSSFVHTATLSTRSGHITFLTDPRLDGNPNAIVSVTQSYNPYYVYNKANVGIYYTGTKWALYNEGFQPMPNNASFVVDVR